MWDLPEPFTIEITVTDADVDRLGAAIVAQDPSFAVYEQRTRGIRDIPVVVFEPRSV